MSENINLLMGSGVILAGIVSLIYIILILTKNKLVPKINKYSHIYLRVLLVGAVLGSFTYEYVLGYEPCMLCWYQRIAIFSLAILSFTANIKNSALLKKQMLIISIAGFLVAIFHNIIDRFPTVGEVCGAGPSCLVRYVNEFGFITIQFMSAITLAAVIIVIIGAKKK